MKFGIRTSANIVAALLIFFIGGFAGFKYEQYYEKHICAGKYEYINSVLLCAGGDVVVYKGGHAELKKKLAAFIKSEQESGHVSQVSVYFRDLHNGPIFGIDETAAFAPASLLKTPLALAYLDHEESQPGFLAAQPKLQFQMPEGYVKKKIPEEAYNLYQAFPPPAEIEPDHPYAVEELLFRMLAYSDNRAYDLLVQHAGNALGDQALAQVFQELGIVTSADLAGETVNVRGYATIFRLLYNSSYLNAELSEKALGWLAQSSFVLPPFL